MAHRRSIAVLGSINMDLVLRCRNLPQPGETILADDAQEIPGGKGANQAVGVVRLGADVTLLGKVETLLQAGDYSPACVPKGVETRWVKRTEDCGSGLAVVCVDDAGENSILVVPGANGRVFPVKSIGYAIKDTYQRPLGPEGAQIANGTNSTK